MDKPETQVSSYLYQQLEQELRQAITQGRFLPGDRLPSIRQLCQQRGLSKATVLHAYERLEIAGLIEVRPRAGYFVSRPVPQRQLPAVGTLESKPTLVNVTEVMGDIMTQSAVFDLLPKGPQSGSPPQGVVELNRCIGRALRGQRGQQHHYYADPAGSAGLRDQLIRRYQRMGLNLPAEQITLTAGCQQALFMALMLCCDAGDVVAVESPGFFGVLQLLESLGLKVVEIPCRPETGMDMDALEQVLQQWPVKACVVTPAFSTPTGALMPAEARHRLLALASAYDLMVIEDDIYGDIGFEFRPSPLKADDREGRVILCGSASKSLSRDLRLGWICAGELQPRINHLKMVNLLSGNSFVEQGVADFIATGHYERHLRRMREQLRQQRDQLLQLLDQHWQQPCRASEPAGGLALWLELDADIDTLALYRRARQQGIIITPGALFTSQSRYRNCLRMSFDLPWDEKRRDALIRLGTLLD